ncbi:HEAT repeat domain-containing protein [Novipirellula sp. SH528]|uniref:HEAT repeat domain-containing protein n=1 Tax=Novipirellula sp. SH528 TaxID=3454466 RepID=UPI003F9F1282
MVDRRIFVKQAVASALSLSMIPTFERSSAADDDLFFDATQRIETLAIDLNNDRVIKTTIESVPPLYEWAQSAYYICLFSPDENTRVLAAHCMVKEHLSFRELLPLFPSLLDHYNWEVRYMIPRLLWRYGVDARMAIPRLEECLNDHDPWFRILSAKALAVIEPPMREQMIPIVEREIDHPEYGRFAGSVLSELKGEVPYRAL